MKKINGQWKLPSEIKRIRTTKNKDNGSFNQKNLLPNSNTRGQTVGFSRNTIGSRSTKSKPKLRTLGGDDSDDSGDDDWD